MGRASGVDVEAAWDGNPVVVMRDFPRFHTLNSAGVFFHRGPAAEFFLKLLFDKMHFEGLPDFDQSCFDQSVIEFLDLWKASKSANQPAWKRVPLRSSACLAHQLPELKGTNILEPYAYCWHNFVDSLLGPFGQRSFTDSPVRFIDPEQLDINYVIGGRSWAVTPLLWHFAGKIKHERKEGGESLFDHTVKILWNMTRLPVGLESRHTCSSWERAAGRAVCHPGTEVVDCRKSWLAFC